VTKPTLPIVLALLVIGLASTVGAQRGSGSARADFIVDYDSPPPTLSGLAAHAEAIVRGKLLDQRPAYNASLGDLTVYQVAILETFKADRQVVASTTVSAYLRGGPFSEDVSKDIEVILFLQSNIHLRDGDSRYGYFIAYGPHGAYRLVDGHWAPFERSALGDAQRVKSASTFLSDLRKAAPPATYQRRP
jgi:hypothetical protein